MSKSAHECTHKPTTKRGSRLTCEKCPTVFNPIIDFKRIDRMSRWIRQGGMGSRSCPFLSFPILSCSNNIYICDVFSPVIVSRSFQGNPIPSIPLKPLEGSLSHLWAQQQLQSRASSLNTYVLRTFQPLIVNGPHISLEQNFMVRREFKIAGLLCL